MNLLRLREQSPGAAEQMPEAEEQTPEAEEQTPEAEETGTCGGGCSYLPHHGLRSPCIYCLPLLHESRLEQLHKSAWTMDLFPFLKLSLGRSVLDPCNLFPDFGSVPYPPPQLPELQGYSRFGEGGEGKQSLAIPRDNKLSRKNVQLLIRACLACSPMHPCGVCHPRLLRAGSHLSGCLSQCLVP